MSSSQEDPTGNDNWGNNQEEATTRKNDGSPPPAPITTPPSSAAAAVPVVESDDADAAAAANEGSSLSSFSPTTTSQHDSSEDKVSSSSSSSDSESSTVRSVVGTGAVKLSDSINDNLIAVRYATIASIGLLTAYGISHTPLFSRFRNVSDIPSSYFVKRKSIVCRTIQRQPQTTRINANALLPEGPIQIELRNLSPFERILPLSWYDWFMKMHPSASALGSTASKRRPDESQDQLLKVELAGVQTPPDYLSYEREQNGDWFAEFVRRRPVVTCQLLARRVILDTNNDGAAVDNSIASPRNQRRTYKRQIPGFEIENSDDKDIVKYSPNQIAHCRIYYRPEWFQVFSKDLAVSMVLNGRASALTDGLYYNRRQPAGRNNKEKIVDTASKTSVEELRKDAAYLDRLVKAEHEAAKEMRGMWADPNVRDNYRPDVVKEIEFQANASVFQKLWRFLFRGG